MSTRARRSREGPAPGSVVARPGRIRLLGPLAALLLPTALLGLAAAIFFGYPCEGSACVRPSLVSYFLVLLAAPTALLAGLPWFLHPLNVGLTVVSSVVLWVALGRWSARRATEDVDAGWRAYVAELALVLAGIWGGIVVGLAVVGLWLSH
ncbi:MAG: hypothetical protein KDB10_23435 [Acidimicrobiales bacterium]|nr:hypothetical protein [Acidimicrobiales bacterium]MCB9372839.1 hypothetical protein [Microthrixaceae bacterium]